MAVTQVDGTVQILDGTINEAKQLLADNTTQDVSITRHGYAPKAPNDATQFLNGVGAYAVPAGAGGGSGSITYARSFLTMGG